MDFSSSETRSSLGKSISHQSSYVVIVDSSVHRDGNREKSVPSFCGSTFSIYNPYIRVFYGFSCLLLVFVTIFHSYTFYFERDRWYLVSIMDLSDLVYAFVILFRVRTSYMMQGIEQFNLLKIRDRYHKSFYIVLDIVSYLPVNKIIWLTSTQNSDDTDWFYQNLAPNIYLRVHFIFFYLELRGMEPGTSTSIFRTLKYIIITGLVIHLSCCFWYNLACWPINDFGRMVEHCEPKSWYTEFPTDMREKVMLYINDYIKDNSTKQEVVAESTFQLSSSYVGSLYWSTATLTSTGYGDVKAHTTVEKIYSIGLMLLSIVIVFGMVLSGMTSILDNLDAKRATFSHRYKTFFLEVERMEVSWTARDLCLRYLDYVWEQWSGQNIYTNGTLQVLPEALRTRFCETTFEPFITKVGLFNGTTQAFRRNLALIIELKIFLKDQYIQRSGEIGDCLCYIHEGIVEVMDLQETETLALMHTGKTFGEIHLVYDLPHTYTIRCKSNCIIYMIEKNLFRELLSDYPEDAERFLERATEKCKGVRAKWPIEPLGHHNLLNHVHQIEINSRRRSIVETDDHSPLFGRRMVAENAFIVRKSDIMRYSAVSSAMYQGADLIRVSMPSDEDNLQREESTLSYLNIIYRNLKKPDEDNKAVKKKKTTRRKSVMLDDEIEVFADFHANSGHKQRRPTVQHENQEEKTTKSLSFYEKFLVLTAVNPDGRFLRIWRYVVTIISVFAAVHCTFTAFFMTSPAPGKVLDADDLRKMDLLQTAVDTSCDDVAKSLYIQECYDEDRDDLETMGLCLMNVSRHFSLLLTRHGVGNYSLRIPSSYDISTAGMSPETDVGLANILIAYLVIDLTFWLNILINFRIYIVTPLNTFIGFGSIAQVYCQPHGRFWSDLAAVLPLECIAPLTSCSRYGQVSAWSFLRLNRLISFFCNVPAYFARQERRHTSNIALVRAVKFTLYIYMVTHGCACFLYWWACGYVVLDDVEQVALKCEFGSWGWMYGISHKTRKTSDYIKTYYWITTTQTTTGYGDILPATESERILIIITMLMGSILYGWLVAVIACTISKNLHDKAIFQQNMLATKHYLTAQKVPQPIINRVMNIRRLEWQRYRGEAVPGGPIIGSEDLPVGLRDMLLYESVGKYLRAISYFANASNSFILGLCHHVKTFLFNPGDIVVYEHELSRNLYIVRRGHCNSIDGKLDYIIDHYQPGDYFGELEVFFNLPTPCTVVADTTCELLVVSYENLHQVLADFPYFRAHVNAIETNYEYRARVLDEIEAKFLERNNPTFGMRDKFGVESVDETSYFTERLHHLPFMNRLDSSFRDHNVSAQGKHSKWYCIDLFNCLLMPITFNPESKRYVTYEMVSAFLALITLFITPLEFAFLPSNIFLIILQHVLDGWGVFNIYIRAHTVYHDKGGLPVTHPSKTAKYYLSSPGFVVDFFTLCPLELIILAILPGGSRSEQQYRFYALFRVFRVVGLYKIVYFLNYCLNDIRVKRVWLKYLSYIIYGLILHHWFACLLFVSACPPEFFDNDKSYRNSTEMFRLSSTGGYCLRDSWFYETIKDFPALDSIGSVFDQYIISFYFATATLIGVGYGDIHPTSVAESFIAIFVMVAGHVFYSYILGEVSASVQSDDLRRSEYTNKLSHIERFFDVYNVNKKTSAQVLEYYHYLWQRTRGVSPDVLLSNLPPSLHTTVCQTMYSDNISLCLQNLQFRKTVKKEGDKKGFFRLVSSYVKPVICMTGNVLCRAGDIGEEMYFIQRGQVAILDIDEKYPVRILSSGEYFGEAAIMLNQTRSRTAVAQTMCELYCIHKDDLNKVLDQFPDFYHSLLGTAKVRAGGLLNQEEAKPPMDRIDYDDPLLFGPENHTNFMTCEKTLDHKSKKMVAYKFLTVFFAFLSVNITIYQGLFFNHHRYIYGLGLFFDAWFMVDMLISFHTTYYDEQSAVITDLNLIRRHYTKTPALFYIDVIANAPIDVIVHTLPEFSEPHTEFGLLAGLRFNRVLRFIRIVWLFSDWESDTHYKILWVRTCKFSLYLGFIINTTASIWYFNACHQNDCKQNSWTSVTNVTDYQGNAIYSHSLRAWVDCVYWATATMTTTGYGDISPQNKAEMLLSCCAMLIGKMAVGYVLGLVAATLANDESLHEWYEQRVMSVKNLMKDLEFDNDLFKRVVRYFDFTWSRHRGINLMELFSDLPFSLRLDIHEQVCGDLVRQIDIFKDCPNNFFRHLCLIMVPSSYSPGDFICLEGDCRSELYVVRSGEVNVVKLINGVERVQEVLKPGNAYMTLSVLNKIQRPASLQAKNHAEVFTMTMVDLQQVLSCYPPQVVDIILRNVMQLRSFT